MLLYLAHVSIAGRRSAAQNTRRVGSRRRASGTWAAQRMQLLNVEVAVDRNFSLARDSGVISGFDAAPHIKHHDERRKKPREFADNQAQGEYQLSRWYDEL